MIRARRETRTLTLCVSRLVMTFSQNISIHHLQRFRRPSAFSHSRLQASHIENTTARVCQTQTSLFSPYETRVALILVSANNQNPKRAPPTFTKASTAGVHGAKAAFKCSQGLTSLANPLTQNNYALSS